MCNFTYPKITTIIEGTLILSCIKINRLSTFVCVSARVCVCLCARVSVWKERVWKASTFVFHFIIKKYNSFSFGYKWFKIILSLVLLLCDLRSLLWVRIKRLYISAMFQWAELYWSNSCTARKCNRGLHLWAMSDWLQQRKQTVHRYFTFCFVMNQSWVCHFNKGVLNPGLIFTKTVS